MDEEENTKNKKNEKSKVINEMLRRARIEHGWTQKDLADQLDVAVSTVRSWEQRKRSPGPALLARLCKALEMSSEELGLLDAPDAIIDEPEPPVSEPPSDDELADELVSVLAAPLVSEEGRARLDRDYRSMNRPASLLRRVPFMPFQERDENRSILLRRVQSRWISGVLEHISTMPLITVDMRMRPDATASPWLTESREIPIVDAYPVPAEASIFNVYNEAAGELLILGAPGAGKSTLLLELTQELIEQARQDDSHPIPIIFQLPSWAERQGNLVDWLTRELNLKYQVPLALARIWMANDQVLPLLDGLDEVDQSARAACVDAIAHYRQDHGFVPIVVCCRTEDYEALPKRIALGGAVELLPLTPQKIDTYVSLRGQKLETLRIALQTDPTLQEMASTPLMLSVLTLTYYGMSLKDMLALSTDKERRRLVFEQYVRHVVQRRERGQREEYSLAQIQQWLAWLARNLSHQSQNELYVERLQPIWLHQSSLRYRYRLSIIRVVFSIESIMIVVLYAWIRGGRLGTISGVGAGLFGWLGSGPGNSILGWMAPGLGAGLEGGGTLGLVLGTVNILQVILIGASIRANPSWTLRWPWNRRSLHAALSSGLTGGLATGVLGGGVFAIVALRTYGMGIISSLTFGFLHGVSYGLFCALIIGLARGLLVGLLQGPSSLTEDQGPEPLFPAMSQGTRLITGLVIGMWTSISFGVVDMLLFGVWQAVSFGAILGFLFFVVFGPARGTDMIPGIGSDIMPAETVAWSWQHVKVILRDNVTRSLTLGVSIIPAVVLLFGVASALFQGLSYGLRYGLIYGLIMGLIVSISSLLVGVLNGGWSSDLLSERELKRNRPNEGIRRSVYNSLIAGAIFGPIGGLASGVVIGLAFGVVGQLPDWPILSAGFAIVFACIFAVNFALMRGGIAALEHYVLRWYLWRVYRIPFNLIRFLDFAVEHMLLRKVGSSYMFSHRLLLEHFASLEDEGLPRP